MGIRKMEKSGLSTERGKSESPQFYYSSDAAFARAQTALSSYPSHLSQFFSHYVFDLC